MMNDDFDTDPEIAEIEARIRIERARRHRLMQNPDCRDPDHPGCENCNDEEE